MYIASIIKSSTISRTTIIVLNILTTTATTVCNIRAVTTIVKILVAAAATFPISGASPAAFSQLSSRLDKTSSLPYPSAVDLLLPMTFPLWFTSNYDDQPPSLASLYPPRNHLTPQSSPHTYLMHWCPLRITLVDSKEIGFTVS